VDPGVATDLAAVAAADNNWYALILDCNSPAIITAAAAWTESASGPKIFCYNVSDTLCGNSGDTTNVMYTEKQLAHARSFGIYAGSQLLCYSGAALLGRVLPIPVGQQSFAFKTLSGVPADNLTDNFLHAVENNNATVYTTLAGLNLTQFGRAPAGTWVDTTIGTDWIRNQLQIQILSALANNSKLPYTDQGFDVFRSLIYGVLNSAVASGFLASSPAPYVSMPKAASVDSVNRGNRNIPNVSFSATVAGAVNSIQITGVLS
jgi:hypothetical protein